MAASSSKSNTGSYGRVKVELITLSMRIIGFTFEVNQFRRLSDLLNRQESSFSLEDVVFETGAHLMLESCPQANILKKDILIVVPEESHDQLSLHRAQRLGLTEMQPRRTPALAAVPPYLVRGDLALRSTFETEVEVSNLARFFPMTSVRLRSEGVTEEHEVVLVNREAMIAFALMEDPDSAKRALVAPAGSERPDIEGYSRELRRLEELIFASPEVMQPDVVDLNTDGSAASVSKSLESAASQTSG